MKHLAIFLLFLISSCGLRMDILGSSGERISGGGVATAPAPTPEPVPAVGGGCQGHALGGVDFSPNISVSVTGTRSTFTTDIFPPGGTPDEYAADMGNFSLSTGKSYVEASLASATTIDMHSFFTFTATLQDLSYMLKIVAIPSSGDVLYYVFHNNNFLTQGPVFSGRTIAADYTFGVQIDHASGEIRVRDSNGEVVATTITQFVGENLIFAVSSVPSSIVGSTMVVDFNSGSDFYRLTPIAGSQDFCGNPL